MANSLEATDDDAAAAEARIGSALERIAVLAKRPAPAGSDSAIAGRLDHLIAALSAELAGDSHS